MENNYTVYMHTSPSGKRYVGITGKDPVKRWANGRAYRHNYYFTNAVEKYLWENFEHEILFTHLTKKEAEEKEIELIAFYKSNDASYGYNISNGGNCLGTHSEISKQKMSESAKKRIGDMASHYGFAHSEKTKKKISDSKKGTHTFTEKQRQILLNVNKGNKYNFGRILSDETKKKMSEAKKGISKTEQHKEAVKVAKEKKGYYPTSNKKVFQINVDNLEVIAEFESIKLAAQPLRISPTNISKCLHGKKKTAGGYIWQYAE